MTPTVSIIIPTYNRRAFLCETLDSLAQQRFPKHNFEVIVVDDGSMDGTEAVAAKTFPFTLRYFWQPNQGDAEARNLGVNHSQADILVFLDDDILVEPDYLAHLVEAHNASTNRIVVGTEHLWIEETNPLFNRPSVSTAHNDTKQLEELDFVDICSNNMSIRREEFFQVGMMQKLDFPGSSIWCDVDFAYRAFCQGFEFYRSVEAVCWHRDYVKRDLESHKRRMKETAYRAAALFQKYPDLQAHLPMFSDKTPINWQKDSVRLIVRKFGRILSSTSFILWILEKFALVLSKYFSSSSLFQALLRWIVGGHIFQGYRAGLRKFKPVTQVEI
ncbi:MAG: glycosyltransferase family 2 protein [Anaerolineaceae bacterium]|nr:glycosyltransferase family 2 protein [Anaerolineaceae bacterium]